MKLQTQNPQLPQTKAMMLKNELDKQLHLFNDLVSRKAEVSSIVYQSKIIKNTTEELLTVICGDDCWKTGMRTFVEPKENSNESNDTI